MYILTTLKSWKPSNLSKVEKNTKEKGYKELVNIKGVYFDLSLLYKLAKFVSIFASLKLEYPTLGGLVGN